jgi:hypothetical protein
MPTKKSHTDWIPGQPVQVGFAVVKVVMRQVFPLVLQFLLVSIIPTTLHIYVSFICNWRNTKLIYQQGRQIKHYSLSVSLSVSLSIYIYISIICPWNTVHPWYYQMHLALTVFWHSINAISQHSRGDAIAHKFNKEWHVGVYNTTDWRIVTRAFTVSRKTTRLRYKFKYSLCCNSFEAL